MNTPPTPATPDPLFEEARELMNRLLDGELSSDDAARLERLVCEREDVRRYYVLNNHLWCNLAPIFTAAPATAGRDEHLDAEESMVLPAMHSRPAGAAFFADDDDDVDHEPIELPPLVWPEPERPNPWRFRLYAAGALAASVIVAISLAVLLWPRAQAPVAKKRNVEPERVAVTQPVMPTTQEIVSVPPIPVEPPKPVITAQLARAVGAKWSAPYAALAVGEKLPTEPIRLEAGLAEVRFANGVSMILEAPARIHVRTDMQVELAQGRLVATVTPQASGFAVETASARLVDLGTEFGVEVDNTGATQVEVFQGRVQAKPPAQPATEATTAPAATAFATRELVAGQAGRVDPTSTEVADVKLAPLAFVRNGEFDVHAASAAGSSYYRWLAYTYRIRRDPSLALFYTFDKPLDGADDADHVLNGADQSAGKFDLPLGYGGIPDSRPTRANGRWPQKGALDFDATKRQGLFIPDFPYTKTGRLTAAAWVYARSATYWNAIVKNRGDDNTEGPGQFSLGLFEREGTLVGRVAQADGADILARERKGARMPLNQWVHVAMVADGTALRIYRDGQEVGSVPCSGLTPTPKPTWLSVGFRANATGRVTQLNRGEPWDGLIDEIVVFHRALDAQELKAMYEAGRPPGE